MTKTPDYIHFSPEIYRQLLAMKYRYIIRSKELTSLQVGVANDVTYLNIEIEPSFVEPIGASLYYDITSPEVTDWVGGTDELVYFWVNKSFL